MPPRLLLILLLSLAAFCVNAQSKDSTYKVTHDSTFVKKVKDTVKIPYDSSFYVKVVIDTTAKHDSIYKVDVTTITDSYVPVIFQTSHDSIVLAYSPYTTRTRHDTTFQRCFPRRPCNIVTRTVRHDTIKYNMVFTPITATHDTTFLLKVFDTTHSVKDSTGLTIHDSSFLRNVLVPFTAYKDSIIYWDSSYIAKTTHDTTVHIFRAIWGLKIQQDKFVNQLQVAKSLGITAIRPNSLGVKDWDGNLGNVVDWKQNGYFTVLNINWIDNPNLKPYNFVSGSDTSIFKTNFDKICQALVGIVDILIIENEPTNEGYYNWDSALYVHELQMAIPIAHKYGLKIADGCVHLELVDLVRTNNTGANKNAPKVKQLLSAYKNLNLDYVDTHCQYGIKSGYPVPSIKVTVDYIRQQTGHQVICNEYSMTGATTTVVNWFVSGWKEAQVPIVLPWSGDGTKSDAYNLGTTITPIGTAYSAAIK